MPPQMAATVPAELRTVFDRFDGRGQPIAWPVMPFSEPHGYRRGAT
jgi:hypothetical protein